MWANFAVFCSINTSVSQDIAKKMEVTGTIVDYVNGKLKRFDVNHAAWVVFIQQLEFDAVMFENRDFYFSSPNRYDYIILLVVSRFLVY